jgi:hypothetical protein
MKKEFSFSIENGFMFFLDSKKGKFVDLDVKNLWLASDLVDMFVDFCYKNEIMHASFNVVEAQNIVTVYCGNIVAAIFEKSLWDLVGWGKRKFIVDINYVFSNGKKYVDIVVSDEMESWIEEYYKKQNEIWGGKKQVFTYNGGNSWTLNK